jgi:hypothetical protein
MGMTTPKYDDDVALSFGYRDEPVVMGTSLALAKLD